MMSWWHSELGSNWCEIRTLVGLSFQIRARIPFLVGDSWCKMGNFDMHCLLFLILWRNQNDSICNLIAWLGDIFTFNTVNKICKVTFCIITYQFLSYKFNLYFWENKQIIVTPCSMFIILKHYWTITNFH